MKKFLSLITLGFTSSLVAVSSVVAQSEDLHFTNYSVEELMESYENAEKNEFPKDVLDKNVDLKSANFSLKRFMRTIDESWDIGQCSSDWVFAGTLSAEIQYSVHENTQRSFSMQHFISSYCNGGHGINPETSFCKFACLGGKMERFAHFYNETQRFIPWENPNASNYVDVDGGMDETNGYNTYKASHYYPDNIGKYPAVNISGAHWLSVPTFKKTTEDNIKYIKTLLLNNIPVTMKVVFPTSTDINYFSWFWVLEGQDTLFDFAIFNGTEVQKEDALDISTSTVTIIGYNDTDPDPSEHYWVVQENNGVSGKRPEGTYRIPMQTNYSSYFTVEGSTFKHPIMTFGVLLIDFEKPYSSINGNIKIKGKNPASNVNVLVNGNKVTSTNTDGDYFYNGIEKYSISEVSFEKQGLVFNPDKVTINVISDKIVENVEANFDKAYKKCSKFSLAKSEIYNNLLELEKIQDEIHEKTKEIANKKKDQKKKEKILSKVNSNNEKMKDYLKKADSAIEDIPSEMYNCKGIKNCSAVSHKTSLRTARKQVPNILNLIKEDGDYLVQNNARKQNFVNKKISKAETLADRVTRIFSVIPKNNYFCGNDE